MKREEVCRLTYFEWNSYHGFGVNFTVIEKLKMWYVIYLYIYIGKAVIWLQEKSKIAKQNFQRTKKNSWSNKNNKANALEKVTSLIGILQKHRSMIIRDMSSRETLWLALTSSTYFFKNEHAYTTSSLLSPAIHFKAVSIYGNKYVYILYNNVSYIRVTPFWIWIAEERVQIAMQGKCYEGKYSFSGSKNLQREMSQTQKKKKRK